MVKVGPDEKPEYRPKYTMTQLLDPDFRLQAESGVEDDGFEALLEGGRIHGLPYDEVGL